MPPLTKPRVIIASFTAALCGAAFYVGFWLPRHSSYAELGRHRTAAVRTAATDAAQAKGGGSMWANMRGKGS